MRIANGRGRLALIVELVVVIGRHAYQISERDGWSHVAGVTIGQDLSDRVVQSRPPAPQFSLGKSFPGFGPTGPGGATATGGD